jgi:glutamate--cysteine ligase
VTKVDLPGGELISLEPGGQFEFSSHPRGTFGAVVGQLGEFLQLLDELCHRFGLHAFFGGLNPVHTIEQIGLVTPTRRYQLMDRYFPTVGTMGRRMMRQTCSIQVSFDYKDHAQGHELLRTAQYIAPIAGAIFANAPYADGRRTAYRSYRVPIWANTDSSRTGALPGFTEPGFGFTQYLDHVVQAPMFFVQRDGELLPTGGLTFARFNEQGYLGQRASLDDFMLHNSTIFTDVRLKHTVEVRTVDGQDPALVPSVLALLAGILFCERSRLRVRHLLGDLTAEDYRLLPDKLAREGLSGRVNGHEALAIAEELVDLAARGLPTCFPDGAEAVGHLDPLLELVERGQTPADVVLERFGDDAAAWLAAGRTFA